MTPTQPVSILDVTLPFMYHMAAPMQRLYICLAATQRPGHVPEAVEIFSSWFVFIAGIRILGSFGDGVNDLSSEKCR